MDAVVVDTRDFSWTFGGNISFNKNLIRDIGIPESQWGALVGSAFLGSDIGNDATYFNSLEIIRSNNHECDIEATNTNIANTLGKFKGKVAVMGGFISRDSNSRRISNLGRGGSDYTAAIVASALNADCLEIWTDVDGFMAADPKKDQTATVIRQMTYQQAQEMCDKGAKVIYAPTIKPVAEKNIPIWVKNTFNRGAVGTLITND